MTTRLNDDALSRLLDLQDIQRALALYVVAIDTRELSLFDQCFTPDAQIILGGVGEMTPTSYKELAAKGLGALNATQHHLSLPLIDLDGDRAHARCYFMAQHVRNDLTPKPFLMIGGWYTDDLLRTEDGWRITRRIGTALWYDGNPEVLGMGNFPMGATPRAEGHLPPDWLMR
ncbi:MAG: nuclear transport factor 2 family protein [Rhodospirillales bacterium]|nr:nuclear transport factor 2 family protein [Rhodospirillales bacterium]